MAKVEVRIRTCCCCGLHLAAILAAIYSLIYFIILLGVASHGLHKTPPVGREDPNYHNLCLEEATAKDKGVTIADDGTTKVVLVDASRHAYYCSLGMYTAELKYHHGVRFPVLVIDIILYVLLVICSCLLLAAIFFNFHWLMLPWIGFMCLEVLRGIISCIMIFVLSYGSLVRVAVGIFFLGIQLFHITLILIIIAKFQRMYDKSRGIDYKIEGNVDKSIMADGTHMYPTLPSQYAGWSSSPHMRREGYYQPNYYPTYGKDNRGYRQETYQQESRPYGNQHYSAQYAQQHQETSHIGRM